MYKDETQTANCLRMHYIAVRADCRLLHPEAIYSPHGLQITFSYCYWRQKFCCLLSCHDPRCRLELATYRSASLVAVCGDIFQEGANLGGRAISHQDT